MKNPIEFYVVEQDGSPLVFDKPTLQIAQLTSDEALQAAFGDRGSWRRLWLKPVFGKEKTEIVRLCQVPDALLGFRYDANLEPAAQIAVIVERWEGFAFPPDLEAYEQLPGTVLDYIASVLDAHLHPNPVAHPGFTRAFSQKNSRKPSENASTTSDSKTSIPAS